MIQISLAVCSFLGPRNGEDRATYLNNIIDEHGEVCNTVVHVCRFVYPYKRLVENGEEVPEELQRHGLLDQMQHHQFITLARAELQQLLQVREELRALLQFLIDILYGAIEGDVGVEDALHLRRRDLGANCLALYDSNDVIHTQKLRLLPDLLLDGFGRFDKFDYLVYEHLVVDPRGEGIYRLLDASNAIVQCQGEYPLHKRASVEGLGKENVKDA